MLCPGGSVSQHPLQACCCQHGNYWFLLPLLPQWTHPLLSRVSQCSLLSVWHCLLPWLLLAPAYCWLCLTSFATFALLTYSNQKNSVHGETIGHGHTHEPYVGPIKALAQPSCRAPASPWLPAWDPFAYSYWWIPNSSCPIPRCTSPPSFIGLLNSSFISLAFTHLNFLLRVFAQVVLWLSSVLELIPIICLVGCWHSDEMFHYLHAQANPLMHMFAQQMSIHGSFTLAPGQHVSLTVVPLLNQVLA